MTQISLSGSFSVVPDIVRHPLFFYDAEGTIRYANPSACRHLNYEADGLVGKDLRELVFSPLLAQALPEAARALAPQGFVYLESPRRWLDDELAAIGLALYRYLKAGAVHAHLLQRVKPVA